MQLLIVRHAIAEDREPGASPAQDGERRLTSGGKRKMRRAAKRLRALVPRIELLATSPLTRAVETAQILSDAAAEIETVRVAELAPGHPPEEFAAWLSKRSGAETIAVVGHEPGLSILVSWLMTGEARSIVELKKGAACLLDCPADPAPGTATLLWSLRPRHLREMRL